MTATVNYNDLGSQLQEQFGKSFAATDDCLEVPPDLIAKVAEYAKNTLNFDFLDMITAADYAEHFELIYRLQSIKNNAAVSFKVKCDKEKPSVPSLTNLWLGASLQEREIYDLFGIEFSGHQNLKRIVLWDDFEGHPLRKDFKGKVYGTAN